MNELLLGFALGMILVLIAYKIIYHCFWYSFKLKGKKHNLKTIRCKTCRNYFYIFSFEKQKECSNCISLRLSKE